MDTRQPLLFPSPPLAPLKKKKKILVKRRRRSPERSCDTEIVPRDLSISNASQPEMCMAREPGPITFRNRPRTHKALRAFDGRQFFLTVFQEHTSLKAARPPSSFIPHSGNLLFHLD